MAGYYAMAIKKMDSGSGCLWLASLLVEEHVMQEHQTCRAHCIYCDGSIISVLHCEFSKQKRTRRTGGDVSSLLYATPPPSRSGPKASKGGGGCLGAGREASRRGGFLWGTG